jgi:hypothetical protein
MFKRGTGKALCNGSFGKFLCQPRFLYAGLQSLEDEKEVME